MQALLSLPVVPFSFCPGELVQIAQLGSKSSQNHCPCQKPYTAAGPFGALMSLLDIQSRFAASPTTDAHFLAVLCMCETDTS